ncbi:early activation antigen CD69-like [Anomaloglossus baeobatrachus]|uniref:early activation antigen CD69-like n=1 Tax=Anomaloglossus baeobatrachus TaxID=238106 RepID=UPI003F4FAC51
MGACNDDEDPKQVMIDNKQTTECNLMTIYQKNEAVNPEYNTLPPPYQKNKAANSEYNILKHLFQKSKAVCLLIAALILVIIGLISALFIVSTSRSLSCDLNNKDEEHNTFISVPDNEIRNQKSVPCEDDWIWYRGKCYYFSEEPDTWRNSEKFCNSHGASLATIENKEELDFLFRFKGLDNHWIGMRRTNDNTAWTWTNGTLYNESLFKIRRSSPENIEYVYLNSKDVGSDGGNFDFKWICKKN